MGISLQTLTSCSGLGTAGESEAILNRSNGAAPTHGTAWWDSQHHFVALLNQIWLSHMIGEFRQLRSHHRVVPIFQLVTRHVGPHRTICHYDIAIRNR